MPLFSIIITNVVASATVQYSKTFITYKREPSYFCPSSSEVCQKNSMLGSQNGPLIQANISSHSSELAIQDHH